MRTITITNHLTIKNLQVIVTWLYIYVGQTVMWPISGGLRGGTPVRGTLEEKLLICICLGVWRGLKGVAVFGGCGTGVQSRGRRLGPRGPNLRPRDCTPVPHPPNTATPLRPRHTPKHIHIKSFSSRVPRTGVPPRRPPDIGHMTVWPT